MSTACQPRVSIVTPAYNEEEYLAECIESVLRQTYQNWDYIIVDNCSTDDTRAIACRYATQDPRIRVVTNNQCLPITQNHNRAIREISPESKYCKFVYADDWLYPTCIEEMVRTAEQYPSAGLVGAYGTDGKNILWTGVCGREHQLRPPWQRDLIPGREIGRRILLGGAYVLGTSTSLLMCCDLVRKHAVFFDEKNLHSDVDACFELLREADFGFTHQVLSFTRPPRKQSTSSFAEEFNTVILGLFVLLLKYGPVFLDAGEYKQRLMEVRRGYYRVLGHNCLRSRRKRFWTFHKDTLAAFGHHINPLLLTKSIMADLGAHIVHPLNALRRGWRWWHRSLDKA